ncbi:MAG: DUF3253 domain-containing protein [Pseudomonadota bacterium]
MTPTEREIEQMIVDLCLERGVGKTICPSEAARALCPQETDWRALMPGLRDVAKRMAQDGKIAIYRKGEPIVDHHTGGAIRLGLPPIQK